MVSAARLVAPMTLAGCTALSVEIKTNRLTPAAHAARAVHRVPIVLMRAPATSFRSTTGTCFSAAA